MKIVLPCHHWPSPRVSFSCDDLPKLLKTGFWDASKWIAQDGFSNALKCILKGMFKRRVEMYSQRPVATYFYLREVSCQLRQTLSGNRTAIEAQLVGTRCDTFLDKIGPCAGYFLPSFPLSLIMSETYSPLPTCSLLFCGFIITSMVVKAQNFTSDPLWRVGIILACNNPHIPC